MLYSVACRKVRENVHKLISHDLPSSFCTALLMYIILVFWFWRKGENNVGHWSASTCGNHTQQHLCLLKPQTALPTFSDISSHSITRARNVGCGKMKTWILHSLPHCARFTPLQTYNGIKYVVFSCLSTWYTQPPSSMNNLGFAWFYLSDLSTFNLFSLFLMVVQCLPSFVATFWLFHIVWQS